MGMDTNAERGAARISRGRPPPAHDDVAADAGREAGAAAQFERAGERDGRRGRGARQLGDTRVRRIYTESRHVCLWTSISSLFCGTVSRNPADDQQHTMIAGLARERVLFIGNQFSILYTAPRNNFE